MIACQNKAISWQRLCPHKDDELQQIRRQLLYMEVFNRREEKSERLNVSPCWGWSSYLRGKEESSVHSPLQRDFQTLLGPSNQSKDSHWKQRWGRNYLLLVSSVEFRSVGFIATWRHIQLFSHWLAPEAKAGLLSHAQADSVQTKLKNVFPSSVSLKCDQCYAAEGFWFCSAVHSVWTCWLTR